MARQERLVNDANTTLNTGINNSVTSLIVDDTGGFPIEGNFRIIINSEIMEVTAISGSTFTIIRGIEGTTAASHSASDTIRTHVTEGSLEQFFRDRNPWSTTRPPYRIVDTNGDFLTSSNFTEVNFTDNAVSTDNDGNITITKDDHAGTSVSLLVRTAPSTPYEIVGAVSYNVYTDIVAGGTTVGLSFRETSSSNLIYFALQPSFARSYRVIHQTSPTGTPTILAEAEPDLYSFPTWFKFGDDGTNITFDLSFDGVNWLAFYSELRGASFTTGPDQVGFFIDNGSGVDGNSVSLLAWDGE